MGKTGKRVVGAACALLVLAGGAELALRLIVPGIIENAVREQLSLSDDHPVEASLGGSALLYALTGRIGDVTLDIEGAPLVEGIAADATMHVDSAPFDPTSGELRGATATLTLPADQLDQTAAVLTQGIAQSAEVDDGELVVGRSLSLFGQSMSINASLRLTASGTDVTVEPAGASVAGFDLSAEQISDATGTLLDPILDTHTVCIADMLPRGISLSGVELSSTGAVSIDATLSPGFLSDPQEREPGVCE